MSYFTTAELRTLPDIGDAARYPDDRCLAAHDWIVAIIERECGTSFIETTHTERVSGTGDEALFLADPYVRAVSAATIDGTALTDAEVADLIVERGAVYRPAGMRWPATSRANVEVTYTASYSAVVPGDLKESAMRAARYWLVTYDAWSGTDERQTSITNDYGNINLAVASADGRPTGLPTADATITAWARRVRVPSVA